MIDLDFRPTLPQYHKNLSSFHVLLHRSIVVLMHISAKKADGRDAVDLLGVS